MAQERIKDIIAQLKALKESKGLSIQDICDTLDRTNNHLAKNTVAKIFSDGSEDFGYQYDTIRTLADVMFHVYSNDADDNAEIKGLKSTVQYQNIIIDQLRSQIETERKAAEDALEAEKAANIRRVEFLRDRVQKQDLRIEQKDRLITIMMMIYIRKLDPDFAAKGSLGMHKVFGETLDEIDEYLNGKCKDEE